MTQDTPMLDEVRSSAKAKKRIFGNPGPKIDDTSPPKGSRKCSIQPLYSRNQLQLMPTTHPAEVKEGEKGYFSSASSTPCSAKQYTCRISRETRYT